MAKPSRSQSKAKGRVEQSKTRLLDLFNKLKGRTYFRVFVLWLASYLVLLSFFFRGIISNYSYLEIFPHEMIFPMVLHAGTALLIALSLCWLPPLRSFFAKLISAITLTLSLTNYDSNLQFIAGPLRAFVPGMSPNDPLAYVSVIYLVLLFVIAVVIGGIAQRLLTKTTSIKYQDIQWGMFVLVGFLFLVPAFSLLNMLPSMIRQERARPPELPIAKTAKTVEKPDIYYIVLDRYASADTLKSQFAFDNTPFTGYLKDNGFHVNDSAKANYPYTAISIASTLNASYLDNLIKPVSSSSSVQSNILFHEAIWQSSVIKAIKKQGYSYLQLGSWYGATYKAPLADQQYVQAYKLKAFGKTKVLRGIEVSEFHRSPYYRLAQIPTIHWWPLAATEINPTEMVRQQLNGLDEIAAGPPGGRFIFAHILVPHDPFTFRPDGSVANGSSGADNIGRPIKQKYTDQVQFINTQMKELVDNIMKQSQGRAVVAFNADEGPYPWVMNQTFKQPVQSTGTGAGEGLNQGEDMRDWSDDWLRMKYGILQAVHIPLATDDDLAHLSSVNLFRIILNRYFDYGLDYLPDCSYGAVHGSQKLYDEVDLTARLNSSSSDYCKQHESLPKQK